MRHLLFALFALTALPAAAQTWCSASGLNLAERTICADPILGDLDARLTAAYRATPETDALRESQRLWLENRDLCGTDIFCIESAYRARIEALDRGEISGAGPLRPWCTASGLNDSERTICASEILANMDAAMQAVYGELRAREDDESQIDWLARRDGCGTDETCLGQAYLSRIIELGGRLRRGG